MDELDFVPTIEELSNVIDHLSSGEARGADRLSDQDMQASMLITLHEILYQCWRGEVPRDMCDAKVITLYKNKGEKNDCNSYLIKRHLSPKHCG